MYTVYDDFNVAVHEGTYKECLSWIMQSADTLSNGNKIFRYWEQDGYAYYDVGRVYHILRIP